MEKKESKQKSPKDTEDAGRIINIVSHQLKRTIFFYTWKDCGLTTMQNRILHYILMKSLERPVYQKDIEKEFRISMKRLLPTQKALTIRQEVMENIRTVENKLKAGIREEDYRTCLKVLKKMSENLSKEENNMKGREEMYE